MELEPTLAVTSIVSQTILIVVGLSMLLRAAFTKSIRALVTFRGQDKLIEYLCIIYIIFLLQSMLSSDSVPTIYLFLIAIIVAATAVLLFLSTKNRLSTSLFGGALILAGWGLPLMILALFQNGVRHF